MELTLGLFGDERLEKGGSFYVSDLSLMAARGSASGNSAPTVPERCGSRGFCITPK